MQESAGRGFAILFSMGALLAVACAPSSGPDAEAPEGGSSRPVQLHVSAPVHHLDTVAREPMVVEHPAGALFVAGYGSQVTGTDPRAVPNLWRSDDGGSNWSRVVVGTAADGAIGNSDVDLAIGPEGELYFLTMGFDRGVREGTHVAIGVSHDLGATWTWSLLSESRFDDRPWVVVAPDGIAHVIWNDDAGVSHAVSSDSGRTWIERERIHSLGGSSHLAAGPDGEVAVRITPIAASANRFHEGVDLIAVSTDGGGTWDKRPAPGQREWGQGFGEPGVLPRWVEPLAWDQQGALFHLWSEGQSIRLGRSLDRGSSWSLWTVATETSPAFFPYLVARGDGELAATWFTGSGDGLAARVASILVPGDDTEQLDTTLSDPFQPDTWVETSDQRVREPGGEYLPVIFLSDGDLGVASPVQDSQGDRFGFSWRRVQRR